MCLLTDFDEKCSKEDDWDVDMGVYYDPGELNTSNTYMYMYMCMTVAHIMHNVMDYKAVQALPASVTE